MSLSIGIVGLPNVGKSTLFNALSGAQNAQVANFPFTTIHPNHSIVSLPDSRLEQLQELVRVPNIIHATVEFVDIAGLVKGASHGEGLGNQFLDQIRNTNAILHVVRCFDDPNVVHIRDVPDPQDDVEIVNIELALADLQQLERKIERLGSAVKGDKKLQPVLDLACRLREHLQQGKPASSFPERDSEAFHSLVEEMRFLTVKPVIYAANVDEAGLSDDNSYVQAVRRIAAGGDAKVLVLCAKLEEEMVDMSLEDRQEFMELVGENCCGLDQVIREGFATLDLISFFTKNESEVRAWNIRRGTTAPKAAGTIHTDFEHGFIRAEVIPFDAFKQYGSDAAVKAHGLMRLEGKEYVVQDGDVIYFRFNV